MSFPKESASPIATTAVENPAIAAILRLSPNRAFPPPASIVRRGAWRPDVPASVCMCAASRMNELSLPLSPPNRAAPERAMIVSGK